MNPHPRSRIRTRKQLRDLPLGRTTLYTKRLKPVRAGPKGKCKEMSSVVGDQCVQFSSKKPHLNIWRLN